ncbi:hypothetical protein BDW22DRAFT_1000365 [Trametopsis cervina]|nr:hypothetical protein BDW22DRAFT_1000365 [Trametopsis cervina]
MVSPPSLADTLGVLVVTAMFHTVLYGVTTVQTFIYYQYNKQDPKILQYSVSILWILDTVQAILMIYSIYFYTVASFGNYEALITVHWTIPAVVLIGAISDVIVTGCFAHRLWKLSVSNWLILVIGMADLAVLDLAALGIKHRDMPYFYRTSAWVWYLTFGSQAFVDIIVTVCLSGTLLLRKTGFARTTSIIHILIAYSIGSCLITSAVSIAVVVTFKLYPNKAYHLGFGGLLPKRMCCTRRWRAPHV